MKSNVLWTLLVAAVLIAPLRAHHSFAADYDGNQPVTLKGKVTRFQMAMPHALLFVEVADEKGKVEWTVEFGNPNALYRNGWTKTTLKAGMEITIKGSRAKDGSNRAHGTYVQLADGTTLMNQGSGREVGPAR